MAILELFSDFSSENLSFSKETEKKLLFEHLRAW